MITTIAAYRMILESNNIRFENLHIDHHNQQDNFRLNAYVGDTLVAYAEYNEFRGEYSISMIEALVKGHGYGKAVMLELARMYGYENITRGNFTKDGLKLRQKVDKELNFDYDKWKEAQNKHLTKEESIDLVKSKHPEIAQFMLDLCLFGDEAWKKMGGERAKELEDKTGFDMNSVADVTAWIKNSATNENHPDDDVPDFIRLYLEKLTQ